jgi:hypothetical protein
VSSIGPIIPLTLQQVASATDGVSRLRGAGPQSTELTAAQQAAIEQAQVAADAEQVHQTDAGDRAREHQYEHEHERREQRRRRRQHDDRQFELLDDDGEDDGPHLDVVA